MQMQNDIPSDISLSQPADLNLERSLSLAERGKQLIGGFTQSMMKKPEQFAQGAFPVYIESGQGAVVTDVDGNEYIDFISGLAANTLGHNHPAVTTAIIEHLSKGVIHSLPTPIEVETADVLIKMIPGAEMARFFKTGADANSAAIRLARYITGKEEIVTVGYNGWHDQYMFDTPGVPKVIESLTHRMPLFTPMDEAPILSLIEERGEQLAAVLLSVPYNRTLTKEFLEKIKAACAANAVLLIFDEIVTGFRLALGGAQEYFGVTADLVTLSKGIAAGMPLSAVVGPQKSISKLNELQVSTTFGGEMLSLAVCRAVLQEYQTTDYITHINGLGRRLRDSVNRLSERLGLPLQVVGYDSIPMFLFAKNPVEHVKFAEPFLAQMAKRGVIMRREVNFICAAHTEKQIDYTIEAIEQSLLAMQQSGIFERSAAEAMA